MKKIKQLLYLLPFIVLLVIFYFTGYGSNNSNSKIEEACFARSVDEQTAQPVEKTDHFSSQENVYLSFKIIGLWKESTLRVEWYQLINGRRLGEDEVVVKGARYLSFLAESPVGGWPAGEYQAKIYLAEQEMGSHNFVVVEK